jgi:hypothetical protein
LKYEQFSNLNKKQILNKNEKMKKRKKKEKKKREGKKHGLGPNAPGCQVVRGAG